MFYIFLYLLFFFVSSFFAENNGSISEHTHNNFETFLQSFEDFVVLRGVTRDTCPNETVDDPLSDFPDLFTCKYKNTVY